MPQTFSPNGHTFDQCEHFDQVDFLKSYDFS